MPVLINPQNNEVHEFGPDESQKLLQQGWLVPLINREGQTEAIPYHEGQEYLQSQGYSLPNDSQLDHLLKQTKYGTTAQKTLAFAEGAARGLTGPAYDIVAPKTGLTTEQNIRERKEYNPELSAAGDIGATVGGALTGTGLPGLIGKAGRAAGVAGKVLGKVGQMAATGAAESALYSAAGKIDEKMLGEPEHVGENLLSHIGLSGFLGAATNLTLAPLAGAAINKAGRLTENALEKISAKNVTGKVADKVADLAIDLAPLGIARPGARYAKKAILDAILEHAPEKGPALNQILHLGELAQKTANAIESHAAGIFASRVEKSISSDEAPKKMEPQEEPKLHHLGIMAADYASDPQKLIDKMASHTTTMASVAPEVSNAMTANVARAVSFLASKIPDPQKEGLLDMKPRPNRQEVAQFNRYAQVVENPVGVLNHLKNGTVLPQDLEALGTVYPQLYEGMKSSVMNQLISKMGKQKELLLPYNKRMSLSLFLGVPLDSTMKGQSILENQKAFGLMQIQRQEKQAIQRASRGGLEKMDPLKDLTRSQKAINRR